MFLKKLIILAYYIKFKTIEHNWLKKEHFSGIGFETDIQVALSEC